MPDKLPILVWLPFMLLGLLIISLNVSYIIEFGIYSNKIKRKYKVGLALQTDTIRLQSETIKLLNHQNTENDKEKIIKQAEFDELMRQKKEYS